MIPILDNGHGGIIGGVYQTAGKRSPKGSKGILYEGMFNRWVVNTVIKKLDRLKKPYYHCSPELLDISLYTRVKRINTIYRKDRKVYVLSVHANAGGGRGVEGYTTRGVTASDKIGEVFLSTIEKELKNQKMRFDFRDGDRDKEKDYYILRKTSCPSFLLEAGFMDNKKDYYNLFDPHYLEAITDAIITSILKLY